MCLFPIPNSDFNSPAYKKGVKFFDCGACPECLHKRAGTWALRAVYESMAQKENCMITLTYDNFVRDKRGNIIGETPVNPDLKVNIRDIQLFFKRLRKWLSKTYGKSCKYLCSAEYGSRTHRAHYHCILFGVKFPDLVYYKKSKRGNIIYMSHILTELWGHGICTVDSNNVKASIARYCTKYCAKSRSDETFMLTSHSIGLDMLYKHFNGKSYYVDGTEYPVPRIVWQRYISEKYKGTPYAFTYRYVNKTEDTLYNGVYENNCRQRSLYRYLRDQDPCYIKYLAYWQRKGQQIESIQPDVRSRILALDDRKYHNYKVAALRVYDFKQSSGSFLFAPGSSRGKRLFFEQNLPRFNLILNFVDHLPLNSRLITASDTKKLKNFVKIVKRC
ncbi:replication initiator protein [Microvirus mar34]|uniref:Replication initiator protein n=1 Tax=Microvirus mar34 TaxID=2851168 RepID=A0A8F5MIZ9_9VIRU|nr:replication initiator protein [Microvirus mar34]